MSLRGKPVWDMELEDYITLRPKRSKKFPEIVKLYLRCKMELAKSESEEERYMKLYYKIKVPPKKDQLIEYLEPEEVKALIDACAKINFELKVLVETLYETGARVGEVLMLRGRDVRPDPDGVVLRLWKSKSKSREVKMVMFAPDILRLAEGKGQDEYVFSYNYNTYLKWLRNAWEMAGLRNVHRKFHILRHTRATQLYGKITQQAMMLIFGWDSEKMIRRYAHVSPQRAFEEYMQAIGAKPKKREEETIKCPRCGHPNFRGAEYCVRCGLALSPERREEIAKREAELQKTLQEIKQLAEELSRLKQQLGV